eukprot:scaffold44758_cov160-Amphora_coffeaeformis.AAC.1
MSTTMITQHLEGLLKQESTSVEQKVNCNSRHDARRRMLLSKVVVERFVVVDLLIRLITVYPLLV